MTRARNIIEVKDLRKVYRADARAPGEEVPEVRARLEGFGGEVRGSTPEEMRQRIASEVQRWSKVIAEAGIPKQ